MVQISLFDFESPPDPINGEARTLSPLDVLLFAPTGAAVKAGEKLTGGLVASIAKLFAPKAVIPSTKGLATVSNVGSRFGGAPFRNSNVSNTSASTANLFGKASIAESSSIKSTMPALPKINLFSNSGINKNLAIGTGGLFAGLGTVGLLTQTEGGQEFTENANQTVQSATKFFSENPIIIAGGIAVLGILLLKS